MIINIYYVVLIFTKYFYNKKYCNFLFSILLLNIFYKINFYYNIKSNINETNFWYLVEILNNNNYSIITILLLTLYHFYLQFYNLNNFNKYVNIVYYIIVIFFIFIYSISNFNLKLFIFQKILVNFSLINGIILIHPIFVYSTYIYFINIIILCCNTLKFNFNNYILIKNKLQILYLSFVGLILGSFWAQQELNWGGWWNWDFVEIVALMFNILSIIFVHVNFLKLYNIIFKFIISFWFYLLCFFIFVRADILNSIHSFNSLLLNNNYKNITIFILLLMVYIFFKKNYKFYDKYFKLKNKNINVITFIFLFFNCFLIMYFFINLFFTFYFNYQFLDITKYIKLILITTLYVFIFQLYFRYLFILFLISIIFLFINYNVLLDVILIFNIIYFFYKNQNDKILFIIHYSFIIFIFYVKYCNYYTYYINKNQIILLNYFINNNNYINNLFNLHILENYFNYIQLPLYNYNINYDWSNFYFKKNIFTNNIFFNKITFISYNLDNIINFILYNIHILIYFLIFLTFIFRFKK